MYWIEKWKRIDGGSDDYCRERSLAIPVASFLCCVGPLESERKYLNLSCSGESRRLLDAAWLARKRPKAVVCRGGGRKLMVCFLWHFLSYFHGELLSGNCLLLFLHFTRSTSFFSYICFSIVSVSAVQCALGYHSKMKTRRKVIDSNPVISPFQYNYNFNSTIEYHWIPLSESRPHLFNI